MADFWKSLFGDNSDAFNQYANEFNQIAQLYNPLINYGQQGMGNYYAQNQALLNDPNALQNKISQGFYESPYQAEMLKRTTDRMNMNAANTGMLGSGAANRALQDELLAMTGQFQNDYINRGMNTYGLGLQGMGNVANTWMPAVNQQAAAMGEAAGGRLQGNISQNSFWPNVIGTGLGLGAGAAMAPFGPGAQTLGAYGFSKLMGNPKSSTLNAGY